MHGSLDRWGNTEVIPVSRPWKVFRVCSKNGSDERSVRNPFQPCSNRSAYRVSHLIRRSESLGGENRARILLDTVLNDLKKKKKKKERMRAEGRAAGRVEEMPGIRGLLFVFWCLDVLAVCATSNDRAIDIVPRTLSRRKRYLIFPEGSNLQVRWDNCIRLTYSYSSVGKQTIWTCMILTVL